MDSYATLDELKAKLSIDSDNTANDAILEPMIAAVSRRLERYAGRYFWKDAVDTTRYYTARDHMVIFLDDVISITTLATDMTGYRGYEQVWAAGDFDLEPYNAAIFDEPYTRIRITPWAMRAFPLLRKGVKVVGRFGWPIVPDEVREATLLQAERWYLRKDLPFGIIGSTKGGGDRTALGSAGYGLDKDVKLMMQGVKRYDVGELAESYPFNEARWTGWTRND
jgi:Phage gp6-like head-tail connector protein